MVRITEDYIVDVDQYNYIAKIDTHKSTVDKQGNVRPRYDIIGYYGTLRDAVRGILSYDVKSKLGANKMSLNEAIKALDMVNNRLNELLAKIPGEAK